MPIIQDVISGRSHFKCTRLRGAAAGSSVCQYCAVGCSQLAFFKDGVLLDVEGDPRSPVNEGRQCPKGATIFALNDNPYRLAKAKYRAPGASAWQDVSIDWILDKIAERIWQSREKGFVEKDENGITVNQAANIGFIGGSANDNEECYLFRKLMTGGLGIMPVENTARYCHSTTVAALGPTFGFGACTNPPRDALFSDCIIIMGSNIAEAHPVAFYWVMQARKNGTATCHIDPRFTRTSAACDHHVPIRPATDIAFILAVIRYIIEHDLWFKEYVVNYTNAAVLINPKFHFDDIKGVFSGWDEAAGTYSKELDSWEYQYEMNPDGSYGRPKTDPALKNPHCVFQLLKKQVAKYTPETAARICGCRPEDIIKVAELMARNSGRDKTTAFFYATGFTQHSTGTQIIRSIAILQLLLGNIGRPGGGIMALRGHSNVQGATDVPTLFGALPNYIPMPHADSGNATLKEYLANGHGYDGGRDKQKGMWQLETARGSWAALPNYMISLLKAWYGDSATPENEFGFQWLPKLSGNYSLTISMERALKGEIDGMFVVGQNMAVTNPNTGWGRDAIRKLKWLVVCDLFETETASAWYADPTAPDAVNTCKTEVFLLPGCTSLEGDGSVTNTERLMQWHERCKESAEDARPAGWWIYQLGKRLKAMAEKNSLPRDAGLRALTWNYDAEIKPNSFGLMPFKDDIDIDKVALEMNGYVISTGAPCQGAGELKDDGSTACGCRLYSGFIDKNGNNLMKRNSGGTIDHEIDLSYRYAWPENSRVLYNRCSADTEGKPWSERKKLIWWDEKQKKWTGYDKPQFDETKPPNYVPGPDAKGGAALSGIDPFTAHSDGKAWIFVPYGIKDGPMPVHYEPAESPYKNILWQQSTAPGMVVIDDPKNRLAPQGDPEYPTVMTTYHMVEHWLSGSMTRHIPWLVALQPETFVEISPEMAEAVGIPSGALIAVKSARATLQTRALVTPRIRLGEVDGKAASLAGSFVCSGYMGIMCDPVTNDLSPAIMAPEGLIPASKSFTVNISRGDEAKLLKFKPDEIKYPESMTSPVPQTPWPAQPEGRS